MQTKVAKSHSDGVATSPHLVSNMEPDHMRLRGETARYHYLLKITEIHYLFSWS